MLWLLMVPALSVLWQEYGQLPTYSYLFDLFIGVLCANLDPRIDRSNTTTKHGLRAVGVQLVA